MIARKKTLYETVADTLLQQIERGTYRPGDRLPGVRRLSQQFDASISTILEACRLLEDQKRIASKPRSGFYVLAYRRHSLAEPATSIPPPRPNIVTGQHLSLLLAQATNNLRLIPLGATVPSPAFLPIDKVTQAIAQSARSSRTSLMSYAFPPGVYDLRREIAKRMTEIHCDTHPDQIVITSGAQESIMLALRALTKPGDIVAVESPTFYGLLQVIDALGLKALEIPTHPRHGISLVALKKSIEQWPVKACILVPNVSNPLGSIMADGDKKKLLHILAEKNIVLIEDDVCGDLYFSDARPRPVKSYDKNDAVIYCSSFSKMFAPGLRVGWIIPGEYQQRIEYLKFVTNLATSTPSQLAALKLLQRGGIVRYLRQVRRDYQFAVLRMSEAASRYFPEGTRITQPQGGFVIWIEFPAWVDAMKLYNVALEAGISIAPGHLFSATQKYTHCIRLNCAVPWSDQLERAMRTLGVLASESVAM